MGWGLSVNAYSFGMSVFKYCMNLLRTRLIQEWQDLHIQYPLWLTHIVMDEFNYAVTLVVMSLACFAVGLVVGIVVTLA